MLALRKLAPKSGLDFADVPEPEPAADEVLVAVRAAGICGSDLHIDDWTSSYRFMAPTLPVTLGHEFCGEVVALGRNVRELMIGDMVVVMPSVTCGICDKCKAGLFEQCGRRRGIGISRDGAFAGHVAVPERNCLAVPPDLDPAVAALTEPLTVALNAVARGGVRQGARVLVMGPGTIGQGIALMARSAGAKDIVVVGKDDGPRLDIVRRLGFKSAIDLTHDGPATLVEAAGPGFDVVFEATGSPSVVQLALDRLRPGGKLVIAGIHDTPPTFDATRLVRNQLGIVGAYRAPLGVWPKVIDVLVSAPNRFGAMISHRMRLAQGLDGFAIAHRREASKIVLIPD